jgi:hypothetical protein
MLFSVDTEVCFPGGALLFTIVKGSSELGIFCTGHISHIVGTKEMVKQEHISVPSVRCLQSRLDIDKARVLAINIGHNVPKLTPVIHKGSSSVRRSCSHFLIHSTISFCRVLSFWIDLNIRPRNIIQCRPSASISGNEVLLDFSKSSRTVLVIYHWLLCCLLETGLIPLLVAITTHQNQVD